MGTLPDRQLVLGTADGGWALGRPEHALLVIGPPRSGKTRGFVLPNVLGAPGPVVSTSTKPDVMEATAPHRAALGRCWIFDPTGQTSAPRGVEPLRWSPVGRAASWDDAVLLARTMVEVARPRSAPEQHHWDERAQALLAPLLHAGALLGEPTRRVVSWVNRRESTAALSALSAAGSELALDALTGVTACEDRELSGIWSTASGVLAAYRTEAALATTERPNFDPARFVRSCDTLYICAPGRHQDLVAPLVSGLVEEVRSERFRMHARGEGRRHPALVLALDEVANIAPLPELPSIVSEGGGQGVMTLACLQDLSQAASRWGDHQARGFLTLFAAKAVLPGVADVQTLQAVSALVGEHDVRLRSRSRTGWRGPWTTSLSVRRQALLAPDQVRRGRPGHALLLEADRPASWVGLAGPSLGTTARRPPEREPESDLRRSRTASPDRHRAQPGWDVGR